MPSQNRTRRMVYIGLLVAIAMVLGYFERFIPLPYAVPGMKLGLANVVTMIGICYFRKRDVFLIVLLRVILMALVLGNMMSFFYSLAGGMLSFAGMALVYRYFRQWVSLIGISILGSVFHNTGQLSVLAIVSGRITISLAYAPAIMLTGIVTGIFVGLTAIFFVRHTRNLFITL